MMTIAVQTKGVDGTPWGIIAQTYSAGISFWHTPEIGGAPGFTAANPGATQPFIGGSAGFTLPNPGYASVVFNGAVGFTSANPGYMTPEIGGAPGFTGGNPGAVLPYLGGAPGFTAGNPGATATYIGGTPGFTLANPAVMQVAIGGVAGLTVANPAAVQLTIAGAVNASNNPVFVAPANTGAGADASVAGWVISGSGGAAMLSNSGLAITNLVLLETLIVSKPGNYGVMNIDSAAIYLAFDDAAGATAPTIIPLDPAVSKGRQGATADNWPWFTGRIRAFGTAGQLVSMRGQ